jgi:hypothetical protein
LSGVRQLARPKATMVWNFSAITVSLTCVEIGSVASPKATSIDTLTLVLPKQSALFYLLLDAVGRTLNWPSLPRDAEASSPDA